MRSRAALAALAVAATMVGGQGARAAGAITIGCARYHFVTQIPASWHINHDGPACSDDVVVENETATAAIFFITTRQPNGWSDDQMRAIARGTVLKFGPPRYGTTLVSMKVHGVKTWEAINLVHADVSDRDESLLISVSAAKGAGHTFSAYAFADTGAAQNKADTDTIMRIFASVRPL